MSIAINHQAICQTARLCFFLWAEGKEEEKTCFITSDKDGKLGWLRDVSPSQGLLQSAIWSTSVGAHTCTSNRRLKKPLRGRNVSQPPQFSVFVWCYEAEGKPSVCSWFSWTEYIHAVHPFFFTLRCCLERRKCCTAELEAELSFKSCGITGGKITFCNAIVPTLSLFCISLPLLSVGVQLLASSAKLRLSFFARLLLFDVSARPPVAQPPGGGARLQRRLFLALQPL